MKRWIFYIGFLGVLVLAFVLLSDYWVKNNAETRVYKEVSEIPKNKVGLLLGTAKWLPGGSVNLYYKYRLEATVRLFQQGRIDFVLVSGDNSRKEYDEPTTMKEDLVAAGIPEDRIFLDYAGFRTLDSVVRSKEIFGQQSITIISQQFHNERAIFLADRYGIDAIGYNARDVSRAYGFKVQVREKLARCKMMLDLIFGKDPKFLGERVTIG